MFSQLGPLFKTVFRATEHADARLEIRREEKESGRKKNDRNEAEEDTGALWEDSTGVSVSALRTFLFEFLHKNNAPEPASDIAESIVTMPPLQTAPVSSVAARAVKAYGAMAAHNHPAPPPPVLQAPPEQPPEDLASLLEANEIRQIHRLIGELDGLARLGIDSLSIKLDGRTFLDAVAEAIRLQKNGA